MPLPASTQWQLVEEVGGAALLVFPTLEKIAANGELIHNDDSHVDEAALQNERAGDDRLLLPKSTYGRADKQERQQTGKNQVGVTKGRRSFRG